MWLSWLPWSGGLEQREPAEEAAGEPERGDPGLEESAWVGETETASLRVLVVRSNTGPNVAQIAHSPSSPGRMAQCDVNQNDPSVAVKVW